jgi:hypothetical protein
MAGIIKSNVEKKVIRLTIYLLQKKLHKSVKEMAYDLEHCGNPVFSELYNILIETSNNIEREFQKQTTYEIGIVFLWMAYRDTAYKDPVYGGLMQAMMSSKLLEGLKSLVKPPSEWYVNVWNRTKQNTEEKRKRGKIAPYQKSHDESIFTPGEQAKRLKKL